MTVEDRSAAPKLKPRGRPFERGHDPRRNPGGRPRDPLTTALRAQLTEEELATITRTLIAEAKAGNLKAIALIYHRVEGRAVARQEAGGLGEFSRVDLIPVLKRGAPGLYQGGEAGAGGCLRSPRWSRWPRKDL